MYLHLDAKTYLPVRTDWIRNRKPHFPFPTTDGAYADLKKRGLADKQIFHLGNVRPHRATVYTNGMNHDGRQVLAALIPEERVIRVIPYKDLPDTGKHIARKARADGLAVVCKADKRDDEPFCIVPVRAIKDATLSMRSIRRGPKYHSR